MEQLKPKDPVIENNFNIGNDVEDILPNDFQNHHIDETQELPSKYTSEDMIGINSNPKNNDELKFDKGFMNTNGAEISRIIQTQNEVSDNITHLDILDIPTEKNNNEGEGVIGITGFDGIFDKNENYQETEILNIEDKEPHNEEDFGIGQIESSHKQIETVPNEDNLMDINELPKDQIGNIQESHSDEKIVSPINKVVSGGFDDIFDEPPNNDNIKKYDEKDNKANNFQKSETNSKVKKKAMGDSREYSDYENPEYGDNQDYDDDQGDNYYKNNYYNDNDYDEDENENENEADEKDYETYKRDETLVEDSKVKEQKKIQNDHADFL